MKTFRKYSPVSFIILLGLFSITSCATYDLGTGSVKAPGTKDITDINRDEDGDGQPDLDDNCVGIANPDQADTNEDGIGDACQPNYEFERPQITDHIVVGHKVYLKWSDPSEEDETFVVYRKGPVDENFIALNSSPTEALEYEDNARSNTQYIYKIKVLHGAISLMSDELTIQTQSEDTIRPSELPSDPRLSLSVDAEDRCTYTFELSDVSNNEAYFEVRMFYTTTIWALNSISSDLIEERVIIDSSPYQIGETNRVVSKVINDVLEDDIPEHADSDEIDVTIDFEFVDIRTISIDGVTSDWQPLPYASVALGLIGQCEWN